MSCKKFIRRYGKTGERSGQMRLLLAEDENGMAEALYEILTYHKYLTERKLWHTPETDSMTG